MSLRAQIPFARNTEEEKLMNEKRIALHHERNDLNEEYRKYLATEDNPYREFTVEEGKDAARIQDRLEAIGKELAELDPDDD